MKYLLLLALTPAVAQPQYVQPGVDVAHYRFSLRITDDNNRIEGETTVRFNKTKPDLWLDLIGPKNDTARLGMRVSNVALADGRPVTFRQADERVYFSLPDTARYVVIRYVGQPAGGLIIGRNKFGERTFFGDNWPNNARHWLPVVDHPGDKATCEWRITAPAHYRVIANGALVSESNVANGERLTHWRTTAPLPTKVMVFGAARFAVQNIGTVAGVPVSSWLYPADSAQGFRDYAPARDMLAWFHRRVGPYSYEKLANVESTTAFGGMENASNIFYTERVVGIPKLRMDALLAHEIAHQWFGNSATEADWTQIWLSEGFATYFSALYLEHAYGRDTLVKVLNENKGRIFQYAARRPNGVILDSASVRIGALGQLLSPNSYEKGGWVLHMLRSEIGDSAFWRGIRTYYARFRNANATTADFRAAMEQASGRSLVTFFRQWLERPGYPVLEWRQQYDQQRKQLTVTVKQTQLGEPFALPLVFSARDGQGRETLRSRPLRMEQAEQTFTLRLRQRPARVVLDPATTLLMRAEQIR